MDCTVRFVDFMDPGPNPVYGPGMYAVGQLLEYDAATGTVGNVIDTGTTPPIACWGGNVNRTGLERPRDISDLTRYAIPDTEGCPPPQFLGIPLKSVGGDLVDNIYLPLCTPVIYQNPGSGFPWKLNNIRFAKRHVQFDMSSISAAGLPYFMINIMPLKCIAGTFMEKTNNSFTVPIEYIPYGIIKKDGSYVSGVIFSDVAVTNLIDDIRIETQGAHAVEDGDYVAVSDYRILDIKKRTKPSNHSLTVDIGAPVLGIFYDSYTKHVIVPDHMQYCAPNILGDANAKIQTGLDFSNDRYKWISLPTIDDYLVEDSNNRLQVVPKRDDRDFVVHELDL